MLRQCLHGADRNEVSNRPNVDGALRTIDDRKTLGDVGVARPFSSALVGMTTPS